MPRPRWEAFERWLAKTFQGKRSWGSGSQWHEKMDVRGQWPDWPLDTKAGEPVLISAKCSDKGVRITAEHVDQLVRRSTKEHLAPVLAIKIGPYVVFGTVRLME